MSFRPNCQAMGKVSAAVPARYWMCGGGVAGEEEEMVLNKINQKKDTTAMNVTRKCSGTTLKVKHWTGPHRAKHFHKSP
eukprot:scaffold4060_cov190-Amphora_coffeaeformis.AAC.6